MINMETVPVGEIQVNCYVLWDNPRQAIVVDPGAEPERIDAFLKERSLQAAAYMLTHGHVDHIGGLAELCRLRPAPIGMPEKDLSWAFGEQNQLPPFYDIPQRPPVIERMLEDGQSWEDGGMAYRCMATPGHTPGSMCLYFPGAKILLSGDTLFAGSVGRTDLPGGDSRTLQQSLQKIAALPDDVSVYPGHGPATTIRQEKNINYFLRQP